MWKWLKKLFSKKPQATPEVIPVKGVIAQFDYELYQRVQEWQHKQEVRPVRPRVRVTWQEFVENNRVIDRHLGSA